MVALAPPATMNELEQPKVQAPRCSNPLCDKRGKGEPKVLLRIIIEGSATIFMPCPRCETYNVRQWIDGIEIRE